MNDNLFAGQLVEMGFHLGQNFSKHIPLIFEMIQPFYQLQLNLIIILVVLNCFENYKI